MSIVKKYFQTSQIVDMFALLRDIVNFLLTFISAILGFYGMLNQVQYHQAFIEKGEAGDAPGGFAGKLNLPLFKFLGLSNELQTTLIMYVLLSQTY